MISFKLELTKNVLIKQFDCSKSKALKPIKFVSKSSSLGYRVHWCSSVCIQIQINLMMVEDQVGLRLEVFKIFWSNIKHNLYFWLILHWFECSPAHVDLLFAILIVLQIIDQVQLQVLWCVTMDGMPLQGLLLQADLEPFQTFSGFVWFELICHCFQYLSNWPRVLKPAIDIYAIDSQG